MAIGLAPEHDRPAPQRTQQANAEPPPGTMTGIQGHHVLPAANGLDIDDLEHPR